MLTIFPKLLLLALASSIIACQTIETTPLATSSYKHILIDHTIYDSDFNILRKLPVHDMSLIYADGSIISIGPDFSFKLNSLGESVWQINGHRHHMVSKAGTDYFLTISRQTYAVGTKKLRYDQVEKRRVETGELIAAFSMLENFAEFAKISGATYFTLSLPELSPQDPLSAVYVGELSHLNSVIEIPERFRNRFGGGYYLVNEPINRVCFALDENLKKVVWHINPTALIARGGFSHECRVSNDGNVLIFHNASDNDDSNRFFASFLLLRPDGTLIRKFPNKDQQRFAAQMGGGIRELSDGYLMSATDGEILNIVKVSALGVVDSFKTLKQNSLYFEIGDFSEFLKSSMKF